MATVKITVIKKMTVNDVYGAQAPIKLSPDFAAECPRLSINQEFISEDGACPPGFCNWAFADIQRDITHLRFGGSFPWSAEERKVEARKGLTRGTDKKRIASSPVSSERNERAWDNVACFHLDICPSY